MVNIIWVQKLYIPYTFVASIIDDKIMEPTLLQVSEGFT